jgi:hypothetical protein
MEDVETNTDGVIIVSWKVKKGSKRPRSNWVSSRIEEGEDVNNDDDLYRDFEGDNSGSRKPVQKKIWLKISKPV